MISEIRPRLNTIRRWLARGGISADGQRSILESLKEMLLENLKPSHVEEDYYDLLVALAAKLSSPKA